jgi:phosphoenolpyruvate synthase/pyruvate phosphate dikinase
MPYKPPGAPTRFPRVRSSGQPASAGRATGPVHLVHGSDDFADFADGNVLVAKATAPAWTPLFAQASAVVTDGGTLAAHASLVAREYGIPAVVGTGNATQRLHTGQLTTVDGTTGAVIVHTGAGGPAGGPHDLARSVRPDSNKRHNQRRQSVPAC